MPHRETCPVCAGRGKVEPVKKSLLDLLVEARRENLRLRAELAVLARSVKRLSGAVENGAAAGV